LWKRTGDRQPCQSCPQQEPTALAAQSAAGAHGHAQRSDSADPGLYPLYPVGGHCQTGLTEPVDQALGREDTFFRPFFLQRRFPDSELRNLVTCRPEGHGPGEDEFSGKGEY